MSNYEVTGEMFDRVIDSLENEIKKLQEEISSIKGNMEYQEDAISSLKNSMKSSQKKWEPKEDGIYIFIDSTGEICNSIWHNDEMDEWRYHNNNVFQTSLEAQRYKEFREDVLNHSYEFSEKEWKDNDIDKYFIYFTGGKEQKATSTHCLCADFNTIYFKTEEDAQYIIDKYPEELKKWRI